MYYFNGRTVLRKPAYYFQKTLPGSKIMISLTPMTEVDYQEYQERLIPIYAAENVKAGNWAEAGSVERSRQEYSIFLPQGLATPGHYVCKLLNELA